MEAQIRPMKPEDWPSVARIYQQGIDTNMATFERLCPPYEAFDASHLQHCRFVAEQDGEVRGWVALTPVSARYAYRGVAEVSVYIDEAGRGLGLGKRLLQHLIPCAEQAGCWTLQSVILQENAASIRLHEACGFRMVGYRERIGQDPLGQWRNTVLMERRSPEKQ